MIASFFPDHILGRGQNASSSSSRTSVASKVTATEGHKNQLYHRIIYALISDKFIKNRRLRKSSAFALLYLSYVFIKMLPVTLAIETGAGGVVAVATAGGGGGGGGGTGLKSGVTGLTTHSRTLPEMAMGQPPPHLDEDDDDYDDEEYDEYDIVKNKSGEFSKLIYHILLHYSFLRISFSSYLNNSSGHFMRTVDVYSNQHILLSNRFT